MLVNLLLLEVLFLLLIENIQEVGEVLLRVVLLKAGKLRHDQIGGALQRRGLHGVVRVVLVFGEQLFLQFGELVYHDGLLLAVVLVAFPQKELLLLRRGKRFFVLFAVDVPLVEQVIPEQRRVDQALHDRVDKARVSDVGQSRAGRPDLGLDLHLGLLLLLLLLSIIVIVIVMVVVIAIATIVIDLAEGGGVLVGGRDVVVDVLHVEDEVVLVGLLLEVELDVLVLHDLDDDAELPVVEGGLLHVHEVAQFQHLAAVLHLEFLLSVVLELLELGLHVLPHQEKDRPAFDLCVNETCTRVVHTLEVLARVQPPVVQQMHFRFTLDLHRALDLQQHVAELLTRTRHYLLTRTVVDAPVLLHLVAKQDRRVQLHDHLLTRTPHVRERLSPENRAAAVPLVQVAPDRFIVIIGGEEEGDG